MRIIERWRNNPSRSFINIWHILKSMKKSLLTIVLVIIIVLIVLCGSLLALIILGESVTHKFESGELHANLLQIDCPTCSNNPLDVQECITFLQENRNNPQIAEADDYGFDIDNIQHVEKRVILTNFKEVNVRCIYHN